MSVCREEPALGLSGLVVKGAAIIAEPLASTFTALHVLYILLFHAHPHLQRERHFFVGDHRMSQQYSR